MQVRGWFDPMRVFLINPNSTEAMTQTALAAARRAAPDLVFEGWTSHLGPPAIEGPEDGARAVPPLLTLVDQAAAQGAGAIIIACFDDTGLAEAQARVSCPVIGIGQASFVMAQLRGGSSAVITTVPEAIPVIQENLRAQGFAQTIKVVEAANTPVLSLTEDPEWAAAQFLKLARNLPQGTRSLILGCSGAVSIIEALSRDLDLVLIDGVTAAARLATVLRPS